MSADTIENLYNYMVESNFDVEWFTAPLDTLPQLKVWVTNDHTFYRLIAEAVDEHGDPFPGFNSCLYENTGMAGYLPVDEYVGSEMYFENVDECVGYFLRSCNAWS